ncbi:hypothetical protein Nepgr_010951 [Nepenthes gracilis]|uniref:FAS1 domain-containing protein n=1 Tax=Nepenthes gracilis TaxID=150966 RepID=A0AAD3SE62_NEPGR|nr:hypothetical protein Nepgr_010951 [Nepenthes gracilis]
MAIFLIFSTLFLAFISSVTAQDAPSKPQDLLTAIEEMQKANYFAFVMLINMSPSDQIPGNITFLMPKDQMLSNTVISANSVLDFLLRHSIPSPLLFDHIKYFPTSSVIPSSKPDFILKITNNGRRSLCLNNIKIISPNICVAGNAIRCHGIDGVLLDTDNTLSSPACSTTSPVGEAPPALPSPSSPHPLAGSLNLTPVGSSQPTGLDARPQHSGSSKLFSSGGMVESLGAWVAVILWCWKV